MLERVIELCQLAGDAVMDIYANEIQVEFKDDSSPLTLADLKSNEILLAGLKKLTPNIPIISEEGIQYNELDLGAKFWMVDPLDGTKEFIKRNGEFTINVALIENRKPILGVVYAPALDKLYAGIPGQESFMIQENCRTRLNCRVPPEQGLTVLGSRSHANDELLTEFLADKKIAEIIPAGSSLKFCLIAEGRADLYPRLGPTMEWDTAAGHAVLLAAGGNVDNLSGEELIYQKPDFRNDFFVADCGIKSLSAEQRHLSTEICKISKSQKALLKKQKPILVWFTGISGSGKSTLSNLLDAHLHSVGLHSCILDGDNVRQGLNVDLGFTEQDRHENIRRIGHVSRLMLDAGLIVITAFISPFAKDRAAAKALFDPEEFFEIHLDMPIELAAEHDRKGLYHLANTGQISDFTGLTSPYERPENPDLSINTAESSIQQSLDMIVQKILPIIQRT